MPGRKTGVGRRHLPFPLVGGLPHPFLACELGFCGVLLVFVLVVGGGCCWWLFWGVVAIFAALLWCLCWLLVVFVSGFRGSFGVRFLC